MASFPPDPWYVTRPSPDPSRQQAVESLFALGNGYLGVRAHPEEGFEAPFGRSLPGTFLNGFHERGPITYPESAYGYARWRQTMLNVPDARRCDVWIDEARFSPYRGEVEAYEEILDLRAGTVERRVRWLSPLGARVELRFTRFVSFAHPRRAGGRVEVITLDRPVRVALRSHLDGRVENQTESDDPRLGGAWSGQLLHSVEHGAQGARAWLHMRAAGSGMELACAIDHRLQGADARPESEADSQLTHVDYAFDLEAGNCAVLEKRAAYADARYVTPDRLVAEVHAELDADRDTTLDETLAEQRAYLDAWWDDADVIVEGDPEVQQGVRFSLFHLLQAAGRDGRTNAPAKGLTGEGYEGHTFWDTEMYLLPVLQHVRPELARALLANRAAMLPAARDRARELRHDGALFPWRTIDGPEASAFFPAGTAQYHVNAAVAQAFERYLQTAGDWEALWEGGAAAVLEGARFWRSRGTWGRDGAFHLHTVTGPDEYTALIDDDHYTNRMAQAHLRFAAALVRALPERDAERWGELREALALTVEEAEAWRAAADALPLTIDPDLAVHAQDASFLGKAEWPFDTVPSDRRPLLLYYHPLDLYRHQVLKQPDVVMAAMVRPEGRDRAQVRRDYDYYEARTTHDSSLSPCAHGIVAASLGRVEEALEHLRHTARLDLDDRHGNVAHGVHVAAMGGTWMGVVHGLLGLEAMPDEGSESGTARPAFHPRLPAGWTRIRARLQWRGRRLEIDARPDTTRYTLREGEPMEVAHRGRIHTLRVGATLDPPTGPRLRGAVFDLDGVLVDTAELHYRSWKVLADELGIPFDREANEALRGIDRMGSLERILARAPAPVSGEEKASLAERKNALYLHAIENLGPADLLPGVTTLLRALRDDGVRLALASGSRNAPAVLARLELDDAFDAIVDPATLRRGKPDPEIFLRAAEALALPPEDCVGVEDAAAGVAAARAAGMLTVGVGNVQALAAADRVVAGLDEVTPAELRDALAGRTP